MAQLSRRYGRSSSRGSKLTRAADGGVVWLIHVSDKSLARWIILMLQFGSVGGEYTFGPNNHLPYIRGEVFYEYSMVDLLTILL